MLGFKEKQSAITKKSRPLRHSVLEVIKKVAQLNTFINDTNKSK